MNTCVKSREKALCTSTRRIRQSNGASNFGFSVVPSLGICINLICIWEKSPKQSLVLVNQLFSPENLKNSYCYMFFDNFFTSPNLMPKLFKDGIYATGTVRSNRKHRPTLQVDKQMKRGEHDWSACDTISATKWMDNRSVILLSNYHNPSVVQEINRRVKGSKEKVKVSCPAVIREYNTYMGGVDLCDQMKVSYEVDRRIKVRFYLRVFFDFLDISVVNLKTVYDKIQSTSAMSSMDFRFSLARSMIRNFSNRKRAIPTSRPSKRSKGEITMVVDHLPLFAATRVRRVYCSIAICACLRCSFSSSGSFGFRQAFD